MKKEIFLSFRPEFFRPILYDIKKYEYRKRFCKVPTKAYLYLSSPIKKVIGIMELGVPIDLNIIEENYRDKKEIHNRIISTLNGKEKYAIPIESFTLYKRPIAISELKDIDSSFNVPQCYLNMENFKNVHNFLKSQETYEPEFYNLHDKIYDDNFCMTCKEMEFTEEFELKDNIYTKNNKYCDIECGYIKKKGRSR